MADIWWCLIQIPGIPPSHSVNFLKVLRSETLPSLKVQQFLCAILLGNHSESIGQRVLWICSLGSETPEKKHPDAAFVGRLSFWNLGVFPGHLFITHMLFHVVSLSQGFRRIDCEQIHVHQDAWKCLYFVQCLCCVGEGGWVSCYCAWLLRSDQGTCSMLQRVPIGKYGLSESLSVPPDSIDFSMVLPWLWFFASNRIRYGQWFPQCQCFTPSNQ